MVAMGFAYACRSWLFLQDEEMGDRGDGYPDRHYYMDALPVLIVVQCFITSYVTTCEECATLHLWYLSLAA